VEEEIVADSVQDQAARDDAQLRSLGIKPELRRTLGFLSNFAIAFSFISVSTGTYGNFSIGIGQAGPAFFWSWPIVIIGQLIVALVFAELASHFPVAGSIYQWSKRLSNRTLGWFTGWFYFWAQVVTVTAVAVIVAFVIDGIHGPVGDTPFLDTPDPTGITDMFHFISLAALLATTLINAFGVRLLSALNNIGVGTEILGMLVFALVLLFFANNQNPSVLFDTKGTEAATGGQYLPAFALGMFMALFVVYGFDTAGTFGEETVDASRQAPRGVIWSVIVSGLVGTVFLVAVILAIPDMDAAIAEGQALGFPIATTIQSTLTYDILGTGITVGELYLFIILVSVFVCTLAIQGAATRMMFSMSRDRHLPGGALWGHVNGTFKTPANAAIAVGILAAIPILVIGPLGGFSVSIAATGLIYFSYLLTNIGVLAARFRGWPHSPAWFNLGRWGKPVNILAIVYGGVMLLNIAIWQDPGLFGNFGGDGRAITNPTIDTFIKPFGNEISGMPAWPVFETLVGVLIVTGLIYYLASVRGRSADVETADAATGEAVIG
jgi:urea carboxylase system permease